MHDKHAVAVLPVDAKSKKIVGHLPREITKECCLFVLDVHIHKCDQLGSMWM